MILYSTDAPAGWNQLPTPVKQKFYDIADKGDWTAHEAYDHLVPDGLKDNPQEVSAWMDGDPSLGINDKDVSRITSGENGGDYSVDNTVMEDMSVNRSRGPADMTDAEYDLTVEANAADESLIEATFNSNVEALPIPEADLGDILIDGLLPIAGAVKAGTYVAGKCDTIEDKLGWGSIAAGIAAAVLASPLGTPIAAGYAGYKLTKFSFKLFNRYTATN